MAYKLGRVQQLVQHDQAGQRGAQVLIAVID
jgi:hypothetical protein